MSDLDLVRLDKELRHYKARLAGKLGRFRGILRNAQRYRNPYFQDYELHKLAREMGTIGLKYLALQERMGK